MLESNAAPSGSVGNAPGFVLFFADLGTLLAQAVMGYSWGVDEDERIELVTSCPFALVRGLRKDGIPPFPGLALLVPNAAGLVAEEPYLLHGHDAGCAAYAWRLVPGVGHLKPGGTR